MSEAAALAGADRIQFRIDHASEARVVGVLKAVRDASGWDTRPSPRPGAASSGSTPVRGRGVALMFRSQTYWASVCEIAVTPGTGAIAVEKCTIAVDPGIVINPMHLKRQVEGGAVMGISHALFDEVLFDASGVTQDDWASSHPDDGGSAGGQGRPAEQPRGRDLRWGIGGGQRARGAGDRGRLSRRHGKDYPAAADEASQRAGGSEGVACRRSVWRRQRAAVAALQVARAATAG